jgi:nucleoid-associated protein YejK
MIEEFQDRDRKEKEELRREITGTLEAIRALVTDGNDYRRAKNKAYHLQPEDTETKETLKKAQKRAAEQLRKDTLARCSRRSRSSINNRIQ